VYEKRSDGGFCVAMADFAIRKKKKRKQKNQFAGPVKQFFLTQGVDEAVTANCLIGDRL
jgi:hypothetical protein